MFKKGFIEHIIGSTCGWTLALSGAGYEKIGILLVLSPFRCV